MLKEVLHTPTFTCNLISTWQLTRDENCTITFGGNCCIIHDHSSKKPIGVGEVRNWVYYLKGRARGKAFTTVNKEESAIWHQCLGHPSFGSLSILSISCGFKLNKESFGCCDVYHRAKQTRSSFSLSNSRADKPFSLIHCDLISYTYP